MRIWNAGDCPPVFGVRSFTLDIVHTFSLNDFLKVCTLYHSYALKQTPSRGITSTNRGLTTTVNVDNEAAMKNHTTAPQRFTFLFLAVVRANPQAHPHREQITAVSEREARSLLAGRYVLVFAGRLPALEVTHG
ncbi:host cell division inhibitor Icd-like protein [Serratia ureilytica]|uniref:host cell division inhibitor Icd-like protein n=1 Tax=Serratia ureilytica TaxID=300181 RepID=UPI0030CA45FD